MEQFVVDVYSAEEMGRGKAYISVSSAGQALADGRWDAETKVLELFDTTDTTRPDTPHSRYGAETIRDASSRVLAAAMERSVSKLDEQSAIGHSG